MTKKRITDLVLIIGGTFILAVSVEFFILPYNILSGGVAGIAVALEPFFHIDKTLLANVAVLSLLIAGWAVLGRDFARNTLISSLCYPLFTTILSRHPVDLTIDPLLASFYAGLLGGVGIGFVMRTGASTGGMDIPPLILHKITGIKVSTLVMITDALTVMLGILAYDLSAALLGLISVMASGFGINRVLEAGRGIKGKNVQIISDRWEELNDAIRKEINRGTTLFDCQGGYTGNPRKMIVCVVSERQYTALTTLISSVDPQAFVIITDTSDMLGEGFTYSSPNI
ncbi:MAG: YitT family protein [Solobacterium sp.]|nr:YitT family protein [Solobacterium sp.]MBQ9825092.1 YitT family protein [Solobacterium sp.]